MPQLLKRRRIIIQVLLLCLVFTSTHLAAVELAVEISPENPVPGETLRVRLTVTNDEATTLSNVRLELPYPILLDNMSDSRFTDGGDCTAGPTCEGGETAAWNLGDLAPGAGKTVRMQPPVGSGLSGGETITFEPEVLVNGSAAGSASESAEVLANRALTLEIDPSAEPVAAGAMLAFDISYGNVSGTAISSAELRFPLPEGTTFVSADGGGTPAGGEVVWNLGLIDPDAGGQVRVVVQLGPGLDNGDIIDPDPARISGESNFVVQTTHQHVTTRVQTLNELQLTLDLAENPTRFDNFSPVYVTVTNPSASVVTNVQLELFVPTGFSGVSLSRLSDGGVCTGPTCDSAEVASWSIGTLGPGVGTTVLFNPITRADLSDGSLVPLQVRTFADGTEDRWERRTLRLESDRSLDLEVDVDAEPVSAGGTLSYQIYYGNPSGLAVTNAFLHMPIPANTTLIAADGATVQGGELQWDLGVISPGASDRVSATLQLNAGVTSGDFIEVDSVAITGVSNSVSQATRQNVSTRVEALPALSLAVDLDENPARFDTFSPVLLTVTNQGTSVLSDVRLEMFLPTIFDSVSDSRLSDGGDCTAGPTCEAGEVAFWNLGSLPAGSGKTVVFNPITSDTQADGLLAQLRARAFGVGTRDRWEQRTLALSVDRSIDLQVDASADPIAPGETLAYDVHFGNRGGAALTGATLSFPVPVGAEFVSASDGGTLDAGIVSWSLEVVNPGTGGVRRVILEVDDATVNGSLIEVDAVELSGVSSFEPRLVRQDVTTRVEADPALALAFDVGENPASGNRFSPLHLTVTNQGNTTLADIGLELFVPTGFDAISTSRLSDGGLCTGPTCDRGEVASWTLPTLAPGVGQTFTINPVNRDDLPEGFLVPLLARATASGIRDSIERRTLRLIGSTPLDLKVDGLTQPSAPGDLVSFMISFGNPGATAVTDTTLEFPIPSGTTLVVADSDGAQLNGSVVWSLGTLDSGETGVRSATFQLSQMPMGGEIVEAQGVRLSSNETAVLQTDASVRIRLDNSLSFDFSLDPERVLQGDAFEAGLVIGNASPGAIADVEAQMFYPSFLNSLSVGQISGAGDCSGPTCDSGETVTWPIGGIASGGSSSESIMPEVRLGSTEPPSGTLLNVFARVRTSSSPDGLFLTRTLRVGNPEVMGNPEIEIRGNGEVISSGSQIPSTADGTDFGMVSINGGQVEQSFSIFNLGTSTLDLTGNPRVAVSGAGAASFVVSEAPAAAIVEGESVSFTVRFDPDVIGIQSALVTVANSDSDENPYTFAIEGIGEDIPRPDLLFMDGFETN